MPDPIIPGPEDDYRYALRRAAIIPGPEDDFRYARRRMTEGASARVVEDELMVRGVDPELAEHIVRGVLTEGKRRWSLWPLWVILGSGLSLLSLAMMAESLLAFIFSGQIIIPKALILLAVGVLFLVKGLRR